MRHARRLAEIVTLALVAACGGGDSPSTPPAPTVATVTVALASATLDAGATTQATATALDATGRTVAGRTATWSSSAAAVATVDGASGLVTARGAGTAQITAMVDGRTGSTAVTVRAGPTAADTVTMLPSSFVPPFVTIRVGQSVLWDFSGGIDHNVTFAQRAGAPADIPTRSAGAVVRQFNAAGTFPYECRIHPGMTGEVTVER
jgi:plastocyanin